MREINCLNGAEPDLKDRDALSGRLAAPVDSR